MRVGFVTEALRGGKLTIVEVAEVTRHKSMSTLAAYNRRVNAQEDNPVRRLMTQLLPV